MIAFGGNPLDRAGNRRADPAWLARQKARADARFLPFWALKPGIADGRAAFQPWRDGFAQGLCLFLGLQDETPVFAVQDLSTEEPSGFDEMRAAAVLLPAADTAIAGLGRALIDWHRRHGFCANCGAVTQIADGGWRRVCPACGAEHFPRTDPVAIMLPVLGDRCLLGRGARFPEGLWSAFAGFAEPGESLEDTVRRELAEEVNLKVGAVRYHASQPWPFPSSLMLGCYAQALDENFASDGVEIVEARWLTKAELRARLAGEIEDAMKMPGAIAIARLLLADWASS